MLSLLALLPLRYRRRRSAVSKTAIDCETATHRAKTERTKRNETPTTTTTTPRQRLLHNTTATTSASAICEVWIVVWPPTTASSLSPFIYTPSYI